MPPKYLVLLVSVVVLLGGCKKDKPEAPLEGRWTPETATVYHYNVAGTFTRKSEPAFRTGM